ncbi:hypothetical protein GCM10022237_36240 [Nocardioides ginsengisoli]|uniref:Translation initiation factor IF-2 n=1 Tax=Nocardioides ginsengisoli TaxID=363868 RepID=A0ABW3W1U9_9ACTN
MSNENEYDAAQPHPPAEQVSGASADVPGDVPGDVPADAPAAGPAAPPPPSEQPPTAPPAAPLPPAAPRQRWRDRVFGFRSVVAVALAGLILGGGLGVGAGLAAGGHHRWDSRDGRPGWMHGPGEHRFREFPGDGPPGQPGPYGRFGQDQPDQQPGQQPGTGSGGGQTG